MRGAEGRGSVSEWRGCIGTYLGSRRGEWTDGRTDGRKDGWLEDAEAQMGRMLPELDTPSFRQRRASGDVGMAVYVCVCVDGMAVEQGRVGGLPGPRRR